MDSSELDLNLTINEFKAKPQLSDGMRTSTRADSTTDQDRPMKEREDEIVEITDMISRLYVDKKCPHCSFTSRKVGKLKIHLKTHLKGRTNTLTGKTFLYSTTKTTELTPRKVENLAIMRKEQTMWDRDRGLYERINCDECGYSTFIKELIHKHYRTNKCMKSQLKLKAIEDANLREDYKCSSCPYKSKNKSHFQRHIEVHNRIDCLNPTARRLMIQLASQRKKTFCSSIRKADKAIGQTKKRNEITQRAKNARKHCKKGERNNFPKPPNISRCDECPYEHKRRQYLQRHMRVHFSSWATLPYPPKRWVTDRDEMIVAPYPDNCTIGRKSSLGSLKMACPDEEETSVLESLRKKKDLQTRIPFHDENIAVAKPYQCHLCPKKSASRYHLKRHIITHWHSKFKEKKKITTRCLSCDFSIDRSDELMEHKCISQSRVAPEHECDECDYQTRKISAVRSHRELHRTKREKSDHLKIMKCDDCRYELAFAGPPKFLQHFALTRLQHFALTRHRDAIEKSSVNQPSDYNTDTRAVASQNTEAKELSKRDPSSLKSAQDLSTTNRTIGSVLSENITNISSLTECGDSVDSIEKNNAQHQENQNKPIEEEYDSLSSLEEDPKPFSHIEFLIRDAAQPVEITKEVREESPSAISEQAVGKINQRIFEADVHKTAKQDFDSVAKGTGALGETCLLPSNTPEDPKLMREELSAEQGQNLFQLKCTKCGQDFNSRFILMKHDEHCRKLTDFQVCKKIHPSPGINVRFKCDECDFTTKQCLVLDKHKLLHQNRAAGKRKGIDYACDICPYSITLLKPNRFVRHVFHHQKSPNRYSTLQGNGSQPYLPNTSSSSQETTVVQKRDVESSGTKDNNSMSIFWDRENDATSVYDKTENDTTRSSGDRTKRPHNVEENSYVLQKLKNEEIMDPESHLAQKINGSIDSRLKHWQFLPISARASEITASKQKTPKSELRRCEECGKSMKRNSFYRHRKSHRFRNL